MESWSRVIVEWINCLEIAQPPVDDVHELHDCALYKKLVLQICPGYSEVSTNTTTMTATTAPLDERELVSEFIKAEYPEFMSSDECSTGISDELYVASLLLALCSQKEAFHRPMCVNLKQDTQIHIKKFLEMVLPYGKSITREIIGAAIVEMGDAIPSDPPSTPVVRSLREFFNSPAARSAQRFANDRNRELRRLRAQLETEKFEKADLMEDIKIQETKIQNLQKKLQDQFRELKAARAERAKPPTPQSCRKNKRPSDNEERYKRELELLENVNQELQSEIETLRDEREELARRFISKDRIHAALKEKFDHCERSIETLSLQLEMKNNELLSLRMNNEELREHIREIQRSSIGEQSFEMEPLGRARSPLLLNSSEALSSIVDIQLQEAKEESKQLRNQLDGANQRLEAAIRNGEEIKEKAAKLDALAKSLRSTEELLSSSTERVTSLQLENTELNENLTKLGDELSSNKRLLTIAENRRDALESELTDAKSKAQYFEASLEKQKLRTAELESTASRLRDEYKDLGNRLATTEDSLIRVNEDKKALESDLHEKHKKLDESSNVLTIQKSRITELESTYAGAKKETEELKIRLENSEESFSRVDGEKHRLESELRERTRNLEESEALLLTERLRVVELSSAAARAEEEHRRVQNLLESREESLSRVNEEKKTLESNLATTKMKLEDTEILLTNEKSSVTRLESIVTRAEKQSEDFKHRLNLTEEKLSSVEISNESLKSNLHESKKKLEESEISLLNEKSRVAELISAISRLQKDLDDLRDELRSNEESLTVERTKVADLTSAMARDEKNAKDLRLTVEELRKALENEKSATLELKEIVSRSKNDCEELESLLRSREDLLQESLQRTNSLNAELDASRLKISELELSLQSETSKSTKLEAEFTREKENCASLEATLAFKESRLAETETLKSNAESQLNDLKTEMCEIESKLVDLRNQIIRSEEDKIQSLLAKEKIEEYARDANERILSLEEKISDFERRIEEISRNERETSKTLQAELSNKDTRIEELSLRLEETEKRESATAAARETSEKKVAELTKLGEEMESQLAQQRQQLIAIRAEDESLKEELTRHVSSQANLQQEIVKTNQLLEDSERKLREQIDANFALDKNVLELKDAKRQLENKLAEERQRLDAVRADEEILKEKLTLHARSQENLQEEISKTNQLLENSERKLREQIDANVALNKSILELQNAKRRLETKLTEEEERSAFILNEKENLEQELASFARSATSTKEEIGKIEKELQECGKSLQEQLRSNAALNRNNVELKELKCKLENGLAEARERLTLAQTEKNALQEELSLQLRSVADTKERINKMTNNFEASSKNQEEQRVAIATLEEKSRELEELKETLKNELAREKAQLAELRDNLQAEREANAALKATELQLNDEKAKLQIEISEQREQLAIVVKEKTSLQEELSAAALSKANADEEIIALYTELRVYREGSQQLQEFNKKLEEKVREMETRVKTLEAEESRLLCHLETAKQESAASRKSLTEITEELKLREDEIALAQKRFNDEKCENDRVSANLEERVRASNNIVVSLEERLTSAEKSLAEAKLEEKIKEEALSVVRTKLEELSKEKIESELRMKEIILNLQEVRSSQDGVLQAQIKTLKETSCQLEEAEKEIVSLKNSLSTKVAEIEGEKLSARQTELRCEKLNEQNHVQSNLVKELQIALRIEQNQAEESTKRCKALENDVEEIATVTKYLKLELDALWVTAGKACPEIVESSRAADSQRDPDNSGTQRLSLIVQSFIDDVKTIGKAISTLSATNEKLKNNMMELIQVSGSLKLELKALWDSVRRACPELARTRDKTTASIEGFSDNHEVIEISYTVKSFAEDARAIGKAVSILSEANETLKEHLDGEKEIAKEAKVAKLKLNERISRMEEEGKKRDRYISSLVRAKKNLQELLSTAINKRDKVEEELVIFTERWRCVADEAQSVLNAGSSACDELKHLQLKRTELDDTLSDINDRHAASLKSLVKALCRIFVWSEAKLQEAQELSDEREISPERELTDEREIVNEEIRKNEKTQRDLSAATEKIETFANLLESYKASLRSGAIKRPTSVEEKLQSQLENLAKERKEIKEKLDAARMRNAKMEKNMDDLRNENKKLKAEVTAAPSADTELENLRGLREKLENEVSRLQRENDELAAKRESDDRDVENRLKDVHNEYGLKLEKIKQKMKTAYNEQIAKLNEEQEKTLKDKMGALRVQMEKQCRKYTEDIAKYKAHISDLSSRYWDVGEKLLAETQEKQAALRQLEQQRGSHAKHEAIADAGQQISSAQSRLKTTSLDRRDFAADRATRDGSARPGYHAVEVIEEETTTYSTRRHSVKSIQAMGNAFNAEDEESELFDSVYLTDLKEGRCAPAGPDFDRLIELRTRNSLCRPHLKSSYAVETHFQPIALNEDDIKGNELRSPNSRILRERNAERRTTATPRGLKNLFGTSMSKRQDENATGTPKGRRLSNIFRKQRTERN